MPPHHADEQEDARFRLAMASAGIAFLRYSSMKAAV